MITRLAWRMAAAAILLAAAGCSTVIVRDEPMRVSATEGVQMETAPLIEALLDGVRFTRAQALEATWKGRPFTAEVVLRGDGKKVTVVILAPQMRLATITLSRPHRIECERAPQVPESFLPEHAVADIAFATLPANALAKALGPAFAVRDDGTRRELVCGGRIARSLERREGGEVMFRNPDAEYECIIRTLEERP